MPQPKEYAPYLAIADTIEWQRLSLPARTPGWQDLGLENCNCVALTGGQDSGKTTALTKLAAEGFPTVPEGLREIQEGLAKLMPMEEVKRGFPLIVSLAAHRHVEEVINHARSGSDRTLYADRGLGDYIASLSILNMAARFPFFIRRAVSSRLGEPDYLSEIFTKKDITPLRNFLSEQIATLKKWGEVIRYRKVIWLDSMPVAHPDEVRSNSKITKILFPFLVKRAWSGLGQRTTSVPPYWKKLDERVRRILEISSSTASAED